jgi:hypothetical protein
LTHCSQSSNLPELAKCTSISQNSIHSLFQTIIIENFIFLVNGIPFGMNNLGTIVLSSIVSDQMSIDARLQELILINNDIDSADFEILRAMAASNDIVIPKSQLQSL